MDPLVLGETQTKKGGALSFASFFPLPCRTNNKAPLYTNTADPRCWYHNRGPWASCIWHLAFGIWHTFLSMGRTGDTKSSKNIEGQNKKNTRKFKGRCHEKKVERKEENKNSTNYPLRLHQPTTPLSSTATVSATVTVPLCCWTAAASTPTMTTTATTAARPVAGRPAAQPPCAGPCSRPSAVE